MLQNIIYEIEAITTHLSSFILTIFGISHNIIWDIEPIIRVINLDAVIGTLCAGDIEIALISAIILASFDRSLRQRIIGIIFSIITIFILNALRISIIIFAGINFGWDVANITHDLLFRFVLVFVILGYYAIWYLKYDEINKKIKCVLKS